MSSGDHEGNGRCAQRHGRPRACGQQRISNLLLQQVAYTEVLDHSDALARFHDRSSWKPPPTIRPANDTLR